MLQRTIKNDSLKAKFEQFIIRQHFPSFKIHHAIAFNDWINVLCVLKACSNLSCLPETRTTKEDSEQKLENN